MSVLRLTDVILIRHAATVPISRVRACSNATSAARVVPERETTTLVARPLTLDRVRLDIEYPSDDTNHPNVNMTANMSINLPLLTIPLYYILSIYPHGHAIFISSKGDPKRHDNRNPKSSSLQEKLKKTLSARDFAAFERAESCHRNHLENMPLFIATVFAGLLAEQKAGAGAVGLDMFCVGWMLVRVLYTGNYIMTASLKWSYLRSLLYFVGTFWAFLVIGRAALVVGQ